MNPSAQTNHAYPLPEGLPLSSIFQVWLDGQPAPVAHAGFADMVIAAGSGPFHFVIEVPLPVTSASVRPQRWGLKAAIQSNRVAVELPGPAKVMVEISGHKPILLVAHAPEQNRPDPADPAVRFFAAGQVYEVGRLRLSAGETLYIEGGAVVRGALHAVEANGLRIAGHGILDGSSFGPENSQRSIMIEKSQDVVVEGLTMLRPSTWMIALGVCDRVVVRDVAQIGEVVCSDGVDVVGSCDVLIEDCLLTNNDDCVAIKSLGAPGQVPDRVWDWRRDVRGVLVRNCTMLNWGSGNVMEIGFELQAESISDIVFQHIDVIGSHVYSAVFSIHNGDRATVRGVRFEDISVEHMWSKLIDIRIMQSRYTVDKEPGQIRDILFRDIRCISNTFNTPSLIGGFDEHHTVDNVRFENFQIGGKPVRNADDLHAFLRHAHNLTFS